MKYKKAFSLVELAIVGLIISIIMAGIMGSRTMVQKSKIANARSLTVNSPVASMDGLVAWYETTLEKSFNKREAIDGQAISTWYDLNPNIITVRNNATQSSAVNKPLYREKAINDLPVVEFTQNDITPANSHFLAFDGTNLENSAFTLFFVEQRTASDSDNYFLGGANNTTNTNLIVGYSDDTTIKIAYTNNNMTPTNPGSPITSYSKPTAHIYSFTFNFVNKKFYYNGTNVAMEHSGSGAETDATTQYTTAYLGRSVDNYYQGNLGEVILFNKHLNTEDRKAVEHYLSEKWGIEVS